MYDFIVAENKHRSIVNICLALVNTVLILNAKTIREAGEKIVRSMRLMNAKQQNMREICMDDNSNEERQEALVRLEQLRRKGTVVDDKAELASYREEKYGEMLS